MNKKRIYSVFFLVIFLAGCAGGYQKFSSSPGSFGGYSDVQIEDQPLHYKIRYSGSQYAKFPVLKKLALYRAAEVTKLNNFSKFQVISETEISDNSILATTSYELIIKLLSDEDKSVLDVYSTENLLKDGPPPTPKI